MGKVSRPGFTDVSLTVQTCTSAYTHSACPYRKPGGFPAFSCLAHQMQKEQAKTIPGGHGSRGIMGRTTRPNWRSAL